MDVYNDPWSHAAVDAHEVLGQPLPLGTARGVVDVRGQVDHVSGAHVSTVEEVLAGSTGVGRHLHSTER